MNKRVEYLLHFAVWLTLFLSPLMFSRHDENLSVARMLIFSAYPLGMMVVFYTNYLWLTPKHYLKGHEQYFWIINIVLITGIGIFLHFWMNLSHFLMSDTLPHPHPGLSPMKHVFFTLRNMFNLSLAAAIATTIVLAMRWQASENGRREAEAQRAEAEAQRAEAELNNLRNQINPHFLLNTLNNIYALTAFDTEKAQSAIQELSKLLRHMLYDNQQPYVNLKDEVQFIGNYVELMKIRLADNVDVQYRVDIPEPCQLKIAPLIFISLIENAFKHGVSPTEPSFIHISIAADEHQIVCDIENSNHPKRETDRSGHGIGLNQVARRLALSYPDKHQWTKGTDSEGKNYHSRIKIEI